jgi:hypothetical protein
LGDLCGDVRIYNSTIVNNSAAASGNNIHLYVNTNPARPSFINCIIWNPANSIAYSTQTPASSDFVNCAIQDPVSGSTTNSLSLNSSNTDPAGPNFTNPSGNDYSIVFVSPCRDAGTSSGAPATDYLGNNRIYNYDIGAYEVQYSRWKTNASAKTDWTSTGNWEQGLYPGLTGTTGDVIVPYLADDTNAPNISGTTTIASGKYLILEAGAKATLSTISNSGTLRLMAGDDPFSLIVNSYSNNSGAGTEKIELYLTGKELSEINKWHYISPPVSSLGTGTFTSHTNNLAQFVESLPSGNAYQGWIAYDGYNYSTGAIPDPAVFTFSSLTAGQGYNYFHTLNLKYTFSGDLNTTDVSKSLAYTGAPDNPLRGFNLLGNPFSSGLDWDVIANGTYPSNTSKAIHFTQNDADCYYVGGIGTNGATGIIPPMQGFFVKANNTPDILLTFPAATARVHNSIHARYKGASGTIPLVKLSLSENGISDETIVRFDELAKAGYDYDFDAVKMFFSTEKTSIYSSVTGTNYAINGQPFPDIFVEIPVAINLLASGNHNISAIQLQGLDDYNVTLTDKTTGFSTDLKTTPNLAFSASAGLINDRFILKISNATTGIENPSISKNIFNIYSSNDFINIQTIADEWDGQQGSVTVLDLSGKKVSDLSNTEFNKNSITQVAAPSSKGMYFVELRSGLKRYVEKVVIR